MVMQSQSISPSPTRDTKIRGKEIEMIRNYTSRLVTRLIATLAVISSGSLTVFADGALPAEQLSLNFERIVYYQIALDTVVRLINAA